MMGDSDRVIKLECEPLEFQFVTFDKVARGIVAIWTADTEISNIVFIKVLTIGFRWPLIKLTEAFTFKKEGGV